MQIMKVLDIETWKRRQHFEFFRKLDMPHFSLCANVDITALHRLVKQHRLPFFKSVLYLVMRCANDIPEFRYRIRKEQVIEHDRVHPGFTTLVDEDTYSNCIADYDEDPNRFFRNAEESIERVKHNPFVADPESRDDLIYVTCIPWVAFTGVMHPLHLSPIDSVPRITWGKYFEDRERVLMPLSVQAHHALMDGAHAGKYYQKLQTYLDRPETVFH